MNRSRWQICLHSFNSLRFQHHFVIHFNNSGNPKTTAVLIGCFFIEQSSYTGWDELLTNNVKAKTCLFTGQLDVQYMPFTYVTYNRPIRLTQCCTQFKSAGVKILCVLYLHYNVAFSFKCMEIPETKSFISKGFELGTTLS